MEESKNLSLSQSEQIQLEALIQRLHQNHLELNIAYLYGCECLFYGVNLIGGLNY